MPISFTMLADSYPSKRNPCSTGETPNFKNQCAIRMGVCFADAGLSLRSFRGVRCWHQHDGRHVLRAQELANWLRTDAAMRELTNCVFSRARRTPRTPVVSTDYAGRNGIAFFQNFWGAGNQGDHIDLWDGANLRTGALDYFFCSEEVWFWSMS